MALTDIIGIIAGGKILRTLDTGDRRLGRTGNSKRKLGELRKDEWGRSAKEEINGYIFTGKRQGRRGRTGE